MIVIQCFGRFPPTVIWAMNTGPLLMHIFIQPLCPAKSLNINKDQRFNFQIYLFFVHEVLFQWRPNQSCCIRNTVPPPPYLGYIPKKKTFFDAFPYWQQQPFHQIDDQQQQKLGVPGFCLVLRQNIAPFRRRAHCSHLVHLNSWGIFYQIGTKFCLVPRWHTSPISRTHFNSNRAQCYCLRILDLILQVLSFTKEVEDNWAIFLWNSKPPIRWRLRSHSCEAGHTLVNTHADTEQYTQTHITSARKYTRTQLHEHTSTHTQALQVLISYCHCLKVGVVYSLQFCWCQLFLTWI